MRAKRITVQHSACVKSLRWEHARGVQCQKHAMPLCWHSAAPGELPELIQCLPYVLYVQATPTKNASAHLGLAQHHRPLYVLLPSIKRKQHSITHNTHTQQQTKKTPPERERGQANMRSLWWCNVVLFFNSLFPPAVAFGI